MLDSYSCPVCGGGEWSPVETFVYSPTDGVAPRALPLALLWRRLRTIGRILLFARPRRRPVRCRSLTPYQLLRRRVLFEVWFPGRDLVSLTAAYCPVCGFTTYSPRPTSEDVSAKYAFLKHHDPDIGGQEGYDACALQADLERARRVYQRCVAVLGSGRLKVLDYGGGNGKLMRPFVAAGHSCYLVDYNEHPLPGVTKICDDMDAFAGDDTFDLIVCSHVLEHVGDVAGVTRFLRRHLDPNGLLYAEVPQEIWAGLRLEADPVTHINFFTKNSLATLLLLNGFGLVERQQEIADYGNTRLEVIWALARPGRVNGRPGRGLPGADRDERRTVLPEDVRPVLYPPRRASLHKMYRLLIAPRLGRFLQTI